VLTFNFDGTQNNGQYPAPGETPTNVFQLYGLQAKANGEANAFYYPGVGAQTLSSGTLSPNGFTAAGAGPSNWDSLPATSGTVANGIVLQAYGDLRDRVAAIRTADPDAAISINLTGFSRGSAKAVAFANLVNERGIPGLVAPGKATIDTMVLFDPVDQTNGVLNTKWSANVTSSLVIAATNEGRYIMPAMPVGEDATVIPVPAAHADVGGSFNQQGVAAITLGMAREFQNSRGIPVADVPEHLSPDWEQMYIQ
jgi:hypothetical protein